MSAPGCYRTNARASCDSAVNYRKQQRGRFNGSSSVSPHLDSVTWLDEAVWTKVLDVAEIDEGGRVSTIKVVNKSDRLVFLMAGELLLGCKQDRVINASMMVPTVGKLHIPATCVEAAAGLTGRANFPARAALPMVFCE
jgi:hypothetical protein